MESFKSLILKSQPCLFFLQETKFKAEGKLKHFNEYQTYELIRKNKTCGGLAIGALEELEPVFIREAFKRKNRKYIGILPIRGTPPYPL